MKIILPDKPKKCNWLLFKEAVSAIWLDTEAYSSTQLDTDQCLIFVGIERHLILQKVSYSVFKTSNKEL